MPGKTTEITTVATSPDALLEVALSKLPLHAEEGNCREVLAESELLNAITSSGGSRDTAITLIHLVRRQLEALSLLDRVELLKGNWAFISYPASLLGRSWITSLATQGQTLLPADYWGQGDHRPDEIKEEQRALLHRIETNRLHFNGEAQPIRVVHVAWALVRWGEKFLLHRREDKSRPGEKGYGFVGGRFSLEDDVPPDIRSSSGTLREVFNLDSTIIAQHITTSLVREVAEETGMLLGTHYTYEAFGTSLPPFKQVNGPGNRHAYSAYTFHLFQVKLTPAGETHLLARVAQDSNQSPPKLLWFTANEIAAPQRADGAAAYVDALHHAWGNSLLEKLLSAKRSVELQKFSEEIQMLDLPGTPNTAFQFGKTGKEMALSPVKALTEDEWQLLMLLGWHARGYGVELHSGAGMQLLDQGWIDAPNLVTLARSLIGKMPQELEGSVEVRENRFLSLRVESDILFFTAELFWYELRSGNSGGELCLERRALNTKWGCLTPSRYAKAVNRDTMKALQALENKKEPVREHWDRTLRQQLGVGINGLGLRKMWRQKGATYSFVTGLEKISS